MSNVSLDRMVEDFTIALLRSQPALKGKTIVHHDEDREAQTNCIIVRAEAGEKRLDGPGGFDVELTLTYRGGSKSTAAQNDLVASAMLKGAINEGPDPLTASGIRKLQTDAGLAYVVSLEATGSSQADTHSLRRREVKIPLIADSL